MPMSIKKKLFPLISLFGNFDNKDDVVIEPYLRNVWMAKISKREYAKLRKLIGSEGDSD